MLDLSITLPLSYELVEAQTRKARMIYQSSQIQVEMLENDMAHLTFCSTGSVNKLNQETLEYFDQALDAVLEHQATALIISSTKPTFIVGADITEFLELFDHPPSVLQKWLEQTNATFNKLEDLPIPTIALIQGFALGGGCETILACDFRIADSSAVIGLPETKLGIIPGFGGTVRLPRLIGAENAIEWITTGKHHKATQALQLGAIDAIVEEELLLPSAVQLLEQCLEEAMKWQERRTPKTSPLSLSNIEAQMAFATAKAMVHQHAGDNYPAPLSAVHVIEQAATMERDEALRVELEAFIELAQTETARSLIQLFMNDQVVKSKAKKLAKKSMSYERAAVLGAGIMGGGIAYQSAQKGIPIVMKDITTNALDVGLNQANQLLDYKVQKNKLTSKKLGETLNKIVPALHYEAIKPADIVVEAVVEHPQVKAEVLAETEQHVSEKSIIASNTSTISINSLAKNLQHPERFCGMHFFNPVHKMPLVEIIQGEHTSEQTLATIVHYAQTLGKTAIVVKDCPGFFVNRVLFPYFAGFDLLLKEGADFKKVDRIMEKEFGWPMGPAYLLDVVGLDTAYHAQKVMAESYPERMATYEGNSIETMYRSERFGQKNNRGFYQYIKNNKGKLIKESDASVPPMLLGADGHKKNFSLDDTLMRCMLPMLLEAVRCLDEGIVASPAEADMALIYGIGFPAFHGGAFHYIDKIGSQEFVRMAKKFSSLGPLYQIPSSLTQLAERNGAYYSA